MLRPQTMFAAALLFVIGLAVQLPAAADPPHVVKPDWTGTIEVTREAQKTVPMGGGNSDHFQVSQHIVFTFAGDGTVRYAVNHDEVFVSTTHMGTVTTKVHGQVAGPTQAHALFYEGDRMTRKVWGVARKWVVEVAETEVPMTVDTHGTWVVPHTEKSAISIRSRPLTIDAEPTVNRLSHTWTNSLTNYMPIFPGTYFQVDWDGTETVVVDLTRVAGSDKTAAELAGDADATTPRVSILGPSCGCIDPQDPQAPLSYTASASHAGGTFTAFQIETAGQAPVVLANRGGQYARLELDGQGNGIAAPVTLRIGYRYQGQDYLAAPYRVDACAYERAAATNASMDEPTLEEAMADMVEGLAVLAQANEAFKRGDMQALAGIDMERMEQLEQRAERRGDLMTGGGFGGRGCALQVDAAGD